MKLMLALTATLALAMSPVIGQTTHDHTHSHDQPYTIGDLTISSAFSRATLPNAPVAGGFLTITNTGDADDRLIAASSDAADRTEVHEMAMENDVMKMRELTDGLMIPAGETVSLKPGGYHLMMMDLAHPLVEGETVNITLTFEKAGEIEVPLMIGAPNARDADHGAMKHGALDRPEPTAVAQLNEQGQHSHAE